MTRKNRKDTGSQGPDRIASDFVSKDESRRERAALLLLGKAAAYLSKFQSQDGGHDVDDALGMAMLTFQEIARRDPRHSYWNMEDRQFLAAFGTTARRFWLRGLNARKRMKPSAGGEFSGLTDRGPRQDEITLAREFLQYARDHSMDEMVLRAEGLSNKEIAEFTNLTPSNVGVRIHRSLKYLRSVFNPS